MPGRTAKVTITERQQDILRNIRNAPTVSSQLRQRAAIVLLAFDKHDNREIAAEVGLSCRQVSLWRRRWADAWQRLIRIECSESLAATRRAIERVLSDEPRPGPPGKFTPEQGGKGDITNIGCTHSILVMVRHEVVDVAVLRPRRGRQHLLFCQQYPTGRRASGNGGVPSFRDNVSSSFGRAA